MFAVPASGSWCRREHHVDVGLEDPAKKARAGDAERFIVTFMDRIAVQLGAASQKTSGEGRGY